MPGARRSSSMPWGRPAAANAMSSSSRARSWMAVLRRWRCSGSAAWASSRVMSTPAPCRAVSTPRSRSAEKTVGVGAVPGSVAVCTAPRPATSMPVTRRVGRPAAAGPAWSRLLMASGMSVSTRSRIMASWGRARTTTQPWERAASSSSLRSTVFPMPRAPETSIARCGLPGPSASASANSSRTSRRPASTRGDTPKVGRNGLAAGLVIGLLSRVVALASGGVGVRRVQELVDLRRHCRSFRSRVKL